MRFIAIPNNRGGSTWVNVEHIVLIEPQADGVLVTTTTGGIWTPLTFVGVLDLIRLSNQ